MSSRREKKIKIKAPDEGPPEERADKQEAAETASAESLDATVAETADKAAEIEQELEELKQRLQRLGADYQNYQKRAQRQIEQAAQLAREDVALSLLGVLDNFEHTLEKGRQADQLEAVLEGVRIVYDHLHKALAGHGLRRIEVKPGEAFDPTLHEAMLHEGSDQCPENTVIRELSAGYMMNRRTLRPTKVSVAKPRQKPPEETAAGEDQQELKEPFKESESSNDSLP